MEYHKILSEIILKAKEELIEAWYLSNQHLVYVIEGIDTELLNRKTTHHNFHKICTNLLQKGEETSLSYLIWDYIFHLGQMIERYEKINVQRVE